MPSSPMPGRPATLMPAPTPRPVRPCAARWLLSFNSGLQGGECCLCYSVSVGGRTQGGEEETYVFETVEVLVTLAADLTLIWLLLFHAESAWVGRRGFRVDDGESAIAILMQLLGLVTVSLVVSVHMVSDCSEAGKSWHTYLRPFWFL